MSFPKAKIQRFNDIKDCTPSPAKYNIASHEKIKFGIIPNTGKYAKKTSPPGSESGSVHSTPCFQTPTQPLKRKKILGMSFKKSGPKSIDSEELREKIVECNNKDLYIKDLTEQIEEMTEKLNNLTEEYTRLKSEKNESEGALSALQIKTKEESLKRAKEYNGIKTNLRDVNEELRKIRKKYEDLKCENFVGLSKLVACVTKFEILYDETVAVSREEIEEMTKKQEEEIQFLKTEFEDKFREKEKNSLEETEALTSSLQEKIQALQQKKEDLSHRFSEEKEKLQGELEESGAKIRLLEENLKDVNVLTEIQMKERIEEIEITWRTKLEEQERESEAILKECQEISEYSIIQSEVEKNLIKQLLKEKEEVFEELLVKNKELEEEISNLKIEKHAYDLSIVTFQDTIEVLKKRLFNSDRDVEQLKEELEKCEERNLSYERKCTELVHQLNEAEIANEEMEMQYESTSKLMQSQVKTVEKDLLKKVEHLVKESKKLMKDRELLEEVMAQNWEQNELIAQARETIAQSASSIEDLEKKQVEWEAELKIYKTKFEEESEEAAEIRKKYIEKSGKYDELAQQFEQILQELDKAKGRIQELEDMRKSGKRVKVGVEDKENLGSPKCVKGMQSPGPLKDKN